MRNLRTLGLALMAMLALAAVAASAASAQQGHLTTDGDEVTLTGTETGAAGANKLVAFGQSVECPDSSYTGHEYTIEAETDGVPTNHNLLPNGATTATLTPHYKQVKTNGEPNCVTSSGATATVDMNHCDYVAHIGSTTGGTHTYGVTFDIVCPPKKEITVTVFGSKTHSEASRLCDLHVPSQTAAEMTSTVHATDTTNGKFDLVGTVENITVKQTRTSILCPAPTHTDLGVFHLDVEVSGHNAVGNPTNVSLSHS